LVIILLLSREDEEIGIIGAGRLCCGNNCGRAHTLAYRLGLLGPTGNEMVGHCTRRMDLLRRSILPGVSDSWAHSIN
jgi:hypothetical protein